MSRLPLWVYSCWIPCQHPLRAQRDVSKQTSHIVFISSFNQHGPKHLNQATPLTCFALLQDPQSQFATLNSRVSVEFGVGGSVAGRLSFYFWWSCFRACLSFSVGCYAARTSLVGCDVLIAGSAAGGVCVCVCVYIGSLVCLSAVYSVWIQRVWCSCQNILYKVWRPPEKRGQVF